MSYRIKGKKIGIFSDIHIGLNKDSAIWHDVILDFGRWISELYSSMNIDEIVIPGDIFHNRSEISVNTLQIAKEFFEILKDFKIYISTGNHDCYYKDKSDVNSISLLKGWENIVVIDKKPEVIQANNKKIALIPWGCDVNDIPNCDICFGHFEIQSFYMNTYKICEHGTTSQSLLNKSPFILSGHFHKKDERLYKNGKIVYLGSPYQQNFGDCGEIRGVYVLDLEKEELNFIENKKSPVHVKIFLSKLRNGEQNSQFLKENVENNIVSLIVDEEIEVEKISLLNAKMQTLKPKSIRIDYESIDSKIVEFSDNKDYNMLDIEKNIDDFVNSLDIKYKKEVTDYVINLYKELKK